MQATLTVNCCRVVAQAVYTDSNGNGSADESYVVVGGAGAGSSGVVDLSGLDGRGGFVINGIDKILILDVESS